MAEDWPKITARRSNKISPWVDLIEREVEFTPRRDRPSFITRSGRAITSPSWRARRTAAFRSCGNTAPRWSGSPGSCRPAWSTRARTPPPAAARELKEETGLAAARVHPLGTYSPCTARLSNRVHSFFVETGPAAGARPGEPGIEVRLVSPAELGGLIRSGEFVLQLHLGALLLAGMGRHLELEALKGAD